MSKRKGQFIREIDCNSRYNEFVATRTTSKGREVSCNVFYKITCFL